MSPDVTLILRTQRMPHPPQPLRIAIDTGGTFTDCVWIDPKAHRLRMLKVFSTPADPSQAILEALRQIVARCERHPPARHHRRHQHAAGTQRRPHRPGHHARFRRRHRNRTPGPPQTLRLLLRPHRAAGPQRPPLRHQRTHRRRRRNPYRAQRLKNYATSPTSIGRRKSPIHRDLTALLLRQSKERTGRRRRAEAISRSPLHLPPNPPRIPRIRTHLNGRDQRLPATSNATLPGKSGIQQDPRRDVARNVSLTTSDAARDTSEEDRDQRPAWKSGASAPRKASQKITGLQPAASSSCSPPAASPRSPPPPANPSAPSSPDPPEAWSAPPPPPAPAASTASSPSTWEGLPPTSR